MSQSATARACEAPAAVGLPIAWYFDEAVLQIERRELLSPGPTCVGHAAMIPDEGSYVALGGCHAEKLLVRHQGRAQLVSNVCRHRQAQLLAGSGHVKNIVCPIHNWAYDLDGRQVAAPHFPDNPGRDLERTPLTEWNGLLFAGPRDVRQELAPLGGWTELAGKDLVLERVDQEEYDLNWKVFLEVFLEDYHIGTVHPGFRAFVNPDDIRGALQIAAGERFYCEQVNVRWPPAPAGSPLFAEFQKILLDLLQGRRPPYAAIWLGLFPGQLVEWYPYGLVVTTYRPLSPARTRLRSEYYFDRQIAATRRDYVEAGLAVLDEVTAEDQAAAEMLQHGRRALYDRGINQQGPYQQPMEQGLQRFHDCLRSILGA